MHIATQDIIYFVCGLAGLIALGVTGIFILDLFRMPRLKTEWKRNVEELDRINALPLISIDAMRRKEELEFRQGELRPIVFRKWW